MPTPVFLWGMGLMLFLWLAIWWEWTTPARVKQWDDKWIIVHFDFTVLAYRALDHYSDWWWLGERYWRCNCGFNTREEAEQHLKRWKENSK
jgi:hypothetical protein